MLSKITISKPSDSDGNEQVTISIEDRSSGLSIIKIGMNLSNFTKALMGVAYVDAEILRLPTLTMIENLGKFREVKSIFVKKSNYFSEAGDNQIIKSIEKESCKKEWEGWSIMDYGLRTQQPHEKHKATMHRYVIKKAVQNA